MNRDSGRPSAATRHVQRTVALALIAFSIAGSIAVAAVYEGDLHPAYGVVTFLAWGSVAAAAVLWVRSPRN